MATPNAAPAKSEATQFVDALYRNVLLAVKASNAVPSEDDDYHFHTKFSADFAAKAAASATRVQRLLWRLRKSVNADDNDGSDGEDSDDDDSELFEGPEPKPSLTDLVDSLLDDASRQLEIAARGDAATTDSAKQLENKPMVFDSKKSKKTADANANADTNTNTKQQIASPALHTRVSGKPQDAFDEPIDNSTAPFVSKLREKVHTLHATEEMDTDEDMEARHPYYAEITSLTYADWQVTAAEKPYEQIPVENATYSWVDTDAKLADMVTALTDAPVIAVDLEHHSYRSFLGLVCLMQISTATQDFLVDTLALRGKLQVLNRVFCDPRKVKVLHGADMDILWLQRDLGLYVVNLFDTGQAARLLQYPRFSLAYLLKRHCGVDADKQYQLADWRVRPLDRNMVKYAREDTRYLLYIYDQMKSELLTASAKSNANLLLEALRNSSQLCLQVYVKPELSDADCEALQDKLKASVGIPELSALQAAVFSRLYYWRDAVARREDESPAYVMPNHVLIKLATELPLRSDQLFRVCNPVPALVRKHALELTSMISAEKTRLADQGAAPATRKRKWMVEDTKQDTVQTVDAPVLETMTSLEEYKGWTSGRRKAKAVGEPSSVAPSLSQSFAVVCSVVDVDGSEDALRRVKELVAGTAFAVAECVAESTSASTTVAAPAVTTHKPSTPPEDAMPKSLKEEYQLSNRADKRRKIVPKQPTADSVSAAVATAKETADKTQAFLENPTIVSKGFDYAAASERVPGAQLKLETPETSGHKGRGRGGGRGGRGGGRGGGRRYNPFVAVRGGNAAGLAEPAGAKQPVKKIHQMPRSSTFR